MRQLKSALVVIGAVTILVLAANTVAFAATGGKFFLGKSNSANKQTTLTRTTAGPALRVNTKSASNPPLATNGKGKVTNLNADAVDGYDSSRLLNRTYEFTRVITVATGSVSIPISVPSGKYLVSYSAYLVGASGANVGCFIAKSNPTRFVAESRFTAGAQTPGITGSGYIEVDTATNSLVTFVCSASSPFTTSSSEPVQIVMTRVDSVSSASARLAAPSGRTH